VIFEADGTEEINVAWIESHSSAIRQKQQIPKHTFDSKKMYVWEEIFSVFDDITFVSSAKRLRILERYRNSRRNRDWLYKNKNIKRQICALNKPRGYKGKFISRQPPYFNQSYL
jgi:hypothetical protein